MSQPGGWSLSGADHPGTERGGGATGDAAIATERGLELFRSGKREEAIPHLERGVVEGDARAHYLLGVALYNGDHVAADADRARRLLEAAAAAGIAQARVALADMARPTAADPDALISTRAADRAAAHFSHARAARPASLEAVVREMLVPLLRERLEEGLPAAARSAARRASPDI